MRIKISTCVTAEQGEGVVGCCWLQGLQMIASSRKSYNMKLTAKLNCLDLSMLCYELAWAAKLVLDEFSGSLQDFMTSRTGPLSTVVRLYILLEKIYFLGILFQTLKPQITSINM